jgi:phosphoglycolate phosphatase-like HAD superfamily hydrolase
VPADIGQFTDAGMTDPEVGRKTFAAVVGHEPSPQELARVLAVRQKHMPDTVRESTGYRVLDGAPELLERLAHAGYPLGLVTGGTEATAHMKLARAHLNHWFHFGGYGSDSPDRATLTRRAIERGGTVTGRHLDPARVLVVGDTPLDIEAAHAAGAVGVGVASGHYDEDALRKAGADAVLRSLRDPLPGVEG